MKQLPAAAKWLLVLLAFAGIFWLMRYLNDGAARADVPAPDDYKSFFVSVSSSPAA